MARFDCLRAWSNASRAGFSACSHPACRHTAIRGGRSKLSIRGCGVAFYADRFFSWVQCAHGIGGCINLQYRMNHRYIVEGPRKVAQSVELSYHAKNVPSINSTECAYPNNPVSVTMQLINCC
jgi:hypothetical protein|eukprot:COSAG01_NODE_1928_length_8876_cov_12.801641_9_plen_123_part_00